jgi:hypothetical protein
MFNESDCHGVDDDGDHFTIRIDGIFHDDVCEKLNLVQGTVFSKESISYEKLKNLKIVDPQYDQE